MNERQVESSISIIIPCKNEKGNIETLVLQMPELSHQLELVFIEGGSKDGTYEEIQRVKTIYPHKDIKLYRQTGKGKYDAVCLGFSKAAGDLFIIFDADLSVSPLDLTRFLMALRNQDAEFVYGSRLVLPMEIGAMPLLNFCSNKIAALFFSSLLSHKFTDTLCGIKGMSSKTCQRIIDVNQDLNYLDPWGDFSMILAAARLKLKIMEIPVEYKKRKYGNSQIKRFSDSWLLFKFCVIAFWRMKMNKDLL